MVIYQRIAVQMNALLCRLGQDSFLDQLSLVAPDLASQKKAVLSPLQDAHTRQPIIHEIYHENLHANLLIMAGGQCMFTTLLLLLLLSEIIHLVKV